MTTWSCQSGHEVAVGDTVAITYGLSSEMIVRILAGTMDELSCEVMRGSAIIRPGQTITVWQDQLLVKVGQPLGSNTIASARRG